ncbi:MAG: phosphatidylglycerophosphatase A family protein [Planctomycetota bacterium]
MKRLLGTAFGLGLLPVAPGTWGTLLGVALAFLAGRLAGAGTEQLVVLGLAFVVTVGGVPLASAAEKEAGRKDPGWFVLDEVAGYLIAILGHPLTWPFLLGAFLAFRVFDIWKPPPIRRLEKEGGGVGVMADDLMAGIYANVAVWVVSWFL